MFTFIGGQYRCKSKDRVIVEYALRETNKYIGVAVYRIVSTLPAEVQNHLPSPEQVAKLLRRDQLT